jgi:PhzF family phenazine biosynthesis protein
MELPIYQVDAFTSRIFGGNPAAVIPLEAWLDDDLLQAIAAENNLSETAFFVPASGRFHLRWFTPTVEVDLCGHATLATAHVLFAELGITTDTLTFDSASGELKVERVGDRLILDFPAYGLEPSNVDETLRLGLGAIPTEAHKTRDLLAVFESQDQVLALTPDFAQLAQVEALVVIATAPGDDCDFVSRCFAPSCGIDEDPVTGSAHCSLTPYWAQRLGKVTMQARQISARGGELSVELRDDRVLISGQAQLYLRGSIRVSEDGE